MNTTLKAVTTGVVVLSTHAECLNDLAPLIASPETTNAICSVVCTVSGIAYFFVVNSLF